MIIITIIITITRQFEFLGLSHQLNSLNVSFLVRGENQSTQRKNSENRVEHEQAQPTNMVRPQLSPLLPPYYTNQQTKKHRKKSNFASGSRISQRFISVLFPQAIIDGQKVKPGERAIYHQFFYYLFWHFSVCSFLSDN